MDPCSGDSGGPLMYKDPKTGRYVIIGTVQGGGYNCGTDKTQTVDGTDNGIWNNVSYWADWVKQNIKVGSDYSLPTMDPEEAEKREREYEAQGANKFIPQKMLGSQPEK